jgi:hypothetical protein
MGIPYTSYLKDIIYDIFESVAGWLKHPIKKITGQKTTDETDVKYSLPKYIRELNKNPYGVLFFDEITTAPSSVQSMLLTLIQDCECNEFVIPKTTFRVCAGNYSNVNGTHAMSSALTNRMCILHWEADAKEFTEGLLSGWTNYDDPIVETNEEKRLVKQRFYEEQLSAFLDAHQDMVHTMPEEVLNEKDLSYASPRSWVNTALALSYLDGNEDAYCQTIINGLIGEAVGTLFWKFLKDKKRKMFHIDLTQYVGRENELQLPDASKHDQIAYIVKQTMYFLKKDPNKYMELFCRVVNLCHENGYDNFAMNVKRGLDILMNRIQDKDMKAKSDLVISLDKKIKDWCELHSTSVS